MIVKNTKKRDTAKTI